MRRARCGLTMVEVAVSAFVGALVLAGIYETLAASSRGLAKGEAGLAANLTLQRLLERLRADLAGPWPWNPCTYPPEVLRALGYKGDAQAFALERRVVHRWITPYRDFEGPTGDTEPPVAGPIRELDMSDPCKVRWACAKSGKPIWIGRGPGLAGTDRLKDAAPFAELVPLANVKDPPWILVLGPAFWAWDPVAKKLTRWDEEDLFHDPGAGLVVDFSLAPIDEWSANYMPKAPADEPILLREKEMLRIRVSIARTDERTPLTFETTLARGTGPAS